MREVNGVKVPDDDVYAFPLHAEIDTGKGSTVYVTSPGMTLRDYFAGQALTGLCANPASLNGLNMAGAIDRLARDSYALADATLKAREEG